MADELDSRNAAISRKRAPDEPGASASQPTKRTRSSSSSGSSSRPQSATFAGWNRGVRSNIRPTLGRPRLSANSGKNLDVRTAADKITSAGQPVKRSASPSTQFAASAEPVEAATEAGPGGRPAVERAARDDEQSSSEEGEIQSAFSGDDEAVVINVADSEPVGGPEGGDEQDGDEDSDLESGEISDDQLPPAAGFDEADDSGSEDMEESEGEMPDDGEPDGRMREQDGPGRPRPEVIDLGADDGSMMRHPPGRGAIQGNANGKPAQKSISKPVTLADLDVDELRLQLRYYYIGQDPTQIPLSELARCLSCTEAGHASSSCPRLTCHHCGEYNEHFPSNCPEITECTKCGRRGHDEPSCKSQLRATREDLSCILCGCRQHLSADCESHWRTSAFPPLALQIGKVRLYCFECGDAGHLGNECQLRPPRKGLGTSMWSRDTRAGGNVPAQTLTHTRKPPPPSNNQLKKQARARQQAQREDHGHLVGDKGAAPQPKARNSGAIKFGGNIAKNRTDLQNAPKAAGKKAAAKALPASGTGKKKKSKKRGKPEVKATVRPMPSAAKKAFVKGKS